MGTDLTYLTYLSNISELFHGLLLPSVLARRAAQLHGHQEEPALQGDQPAQPQRQDAREDLEARHLLPQRAQLLHTHDHEAEQVAEDLGARGHYLLNEVGSGF